MHKTNISSLVFLIFFGFPFIATPKEVAVIGTFVNQLPDLPKKVKIGSEKSCFSFELNLSFFREIRIITKINILKKIVCFPDSIVEMSPFLKLSTT